MKKYKLKKQDWDNQIKCMDESERLGYTRRIGYHAWIAGQGAGGYESVLDFFDDVKDLIDFIRVEGNKNNNEKN